MFLRVIVDKFKVIRAKKKWRQKNPHNSTTLKTINAMDSIIVGNYSYGELDVHVASYNYVLRIGNYCSIASGVKFILSVEHPLDYISTFPLKKKVLNSVSKEGLSKGDIIVGDDVWIGYGATILSGVHIGQGGVIAAGAVVTKDVPPYAVVGGVPARVIKYRFDDIVCDRLNRIDYSKITKKVIVEHEKDFYNIVNPNTDLSWLPQKNHFENN